MNNQQFPAHLYDQTRVQVGIELLQKESAKLFPSSDTTKLSRDIEKWWSDPGEVKLAELIDFWDAVDAVMGGIKLKSVCTMLTAENYNWSAETLKVKELTILANLEQLKNIPGLDKNNYAVTSIADALSRDEELRQEQLRIVEEHSQNEEQNNYRIVVERSRKGELRVHDGNRRTLLALLRDNSTIDAWVFDKPNEEPRNYWVSIQTLLGLCKIYRHNPDNVELVAAIKSVLKHYFDESEPARVAFQKRVVGFGVKGSDELAKELL